MLQRTFLIKEKDHSSGSWKKALVGIFFSKLKNEKIAFLVDPIPKFEKTFYLLGIRTPME